MTGRLDRDILRFILVGVGSNLANFLGYCLLVLIDAPVFVAAVFGYILGLLCSYHFGRTWVFGRRFDVKLASIGRFLIVYAIGGLGMSTIAAIMVDGLMFPYAVGWCFGAGFAACSNFIGLRWLVFGPEVVSEEPGR